METGLKIRNTLTRSLLASAIAKNLSTPHKSDEATTTENLSRATPIKTSECSPTDETTRGTTQPATQSLHLWQREGTSQVSACCDSTGKKHAERENSSVDYILVDMLGIKAPLTHHVSIKSQANAHMAPDDIPLHTVTSKHPGHLSCSITQSPSAGTLNHTPLIQPYCTAGHFPGNDPSPSLPPSLPLSLHLSLSGNPACLHTNTHTAHKSLSSHLML